VNPVLPLLIAHTIVYINMCTAVFMQVQIQLSWALPPVRDLILSKPHYYLGHLLGHESSGSLLHLLKVLFAFILSLMMHAIIHTIDVVLQQKQHVARACML
jgi:secreted Zn-dependent insulinase-like peptidase